MDEQFPDVKLIKESTVGHRRIIWIEGPPDQVQEWARKFIWDWPGYLPRLEFVNPIPIPGGIVRACVSRDANSD